MANPYLNLEILKYLWVLNAYMRMCTHACFYICIWRKSENDHYILNMELKIRIQRLIFHICIWITILF